MRRILGALQFLTVVPIKRRTTEPWKAAVFFPVVGAVLAAVTGMVVLTARWYFHRRIGGVTGDCLGATSQVVEMSLLGVLACQSCMW